MTKDGLYTYDEAMEIMNRKGLGHHIRKDEISCKLRQFCKDGSSLHVKTARGKRYNLYCTDKDYKNILKAVETENRTSTLILAKSRNDAEQQFSLAEKNPDKKMIIVCSGNQLLHSTTAEKTLKHQITFFTNEDFEFVVDVLYKNFMNR